MSYTKRWLEDKKTFEDTIGEDILGIMKDYFTYRGPSSIFDNDAYCQRMVELWKKMEDMTTIVDREDWLKVMAMTFLASEYSDVTYDLKHVAKCFKLEDLEQKYMK